MATHIKCVCVCEYSTVFLYTTNNITNRLNVESTIPRQEYPKSENTTTEELFLSFSQFCFIYVCMKLTQMLVSLSGGRSGRVNLSYLHNLKCVLSRAAMR